MDGYYIKTPPLSAEDAALAVRMLRSISMNLAEAEHGLRVIGSLTRIASGKDVVRVEKEMGAHADQSSA